MTRAHKAPPPTRRVTSGEEADGTRGVRRVPAVRPAEGLDRQSALALVRRMCREDATVAPAVARQSEQIARAVDVIAHRLRNRKALDLLIENARITDGEWIEPKDAEKAATDD